MIASEYKMFILTSNALVSRLAHAIGKAIFDRHTIDLLDIKILMTSEYILKNFGKG